MHLGERLQEGHTVILPTALTNQRYQIARGHIERAMRHPTAVAPGEDDDLLLATPRPGGP